jgi:hypothetical protein
VARFEKTQKVMGLYEFGGHAEKSALLRNRISR